MKDKSIKKEKEDWMKQGGEDYGQKAKAHSALASVA